MIGAKGESNERMRGSETGRGKMKREGGGVEERLAASSVHDPNLVIGVKFTSLIHVALTCR